MNKSRLFVGLLLVAFLVMFTPASHAQATANCQAATSTIDCQVIAVGSSAIFPSAAIAAVTADPTRGNGPLCGSGGAVHFWTGSANGRDPRHALTTTAIPDEPGTVWIAWDNDTAPTIICAYLSVDSIVGQRLFYAQGSGASSTTNNGQLILHDNTSGTPACTTAGADKVVFVWDTATLGLPSAIYNALQGTSGSTCPTPPATGPVNFTTASTDVRAEDAKFVGNDRVLSQDQTAVGGEAGETFPANSKGGLGYGSAQGCLTPGEAIASAYQTATTAQSICYTFVGGANDPISGTPVLNSQIVSEGALAMLPLISITNTASGGFGDLFNNRGFNDVLSHDLAAGYAFSDHGTATLTRDLYLGNQNPNNPAIPINVVHYLAREPQSGTYTTWEWQVVRNKESALGGGGLSQETNTCGANNNYACVHNFSNPPTATCPNQAANLTNLTFPNAFDCDNYLSWGTGGTFPALKTRVLGTGEMVSVLNAVAGGPATSACTPAVFPAFPCITDTFGYAFWSLGTFGGKSRIRYLQLDSNDALYAGWTSATGGNNGVFPATDPNQNKLAILPAPPGNGCDGYFNGDGGATISNFLCDTTATAWPFPTFANIASGNYRVWSVNRVMWYPPAGSTTLNPNWAPLNAPAFWLSAADQTAQVPKAKIPDFFPFGYCANLAACPNNAAPTLTYPLNAFRSHYTLPAWGLPPGSNGILGPGPTFGFGGVEVGGDVAGSVFTVMAETDSVHFFAGSSFLSWIQ